MGGERIKRIRILHNEHARIPFSVIGIFIILGSSFTTVYISHLELEKSQQIARSLAVQEIKNLLFNFETDVASALNIAGMKALKEIGRNPVIRSSIGTPDEVNNLRIKEIIKDELNLYLTSHYLDNMFSNGHYAINVVLQNEYPIASRDAITLDQLPMELKRLTLPFIGPNESAYHSTYLIASVPLTVDILKIGDKSWVPLTTRSIVVSSILTTRYPLLRDLMNEYHQTINGTFSPLWTFTTVLSNIYTLIRGFKHYRSGKPLNVVDNRHLSVMINGGLLLEQSLIFGSVDPLGLVELVRKTKQMLKQAPSDALHTFNNQMTGEGCDVNIGNLTQGSANVDAESPINESINLSHMMSISEVAERVLYNVSNVHLHFENNKGETYEQVILVDNESLSQIDEAVQYWANQSFYLAKVTKDLVVNRSTQKRLQTIIAEIYRVLMSINVCNRTTIDEQFGDPGEGWTDGGVGQWNHFNVLPVYKNLTKPPKGHVVPGCTLYEECYTVYYERTHSWWRMEKHLINSTVIWVKVWKNLTDLLTESVLLQSVLEHYAPYEGTQDDVVDILYFNESISDVNLEDTLDKYLAVSQDSLPEKQELITTRDNAGSTGLAMLVEGSFSEWVFHEAWNGLEEILKQTSSIVVDPTIDSVHFPNPYHLVEMAKNDLLRKYDIQRDKYLNFSLYNPGGGFQSVGKKAVYYSREWYVDFVKNMTGAVFSQISEQITDAFNTTIPSYADFSSQNITQTLDDVSDAIQNQLTIPFGYQMDLMRYRNQMTDWNETVRLAVDQVPNYLDPFTKTQCGDEELWTLKVRNRCVFGPTGLPLLPPTPVTPWLLTMNCWVIDVQGEYVQIKIIDTSDETIFHPLLGHEPQTYVRELSVITASNITLGENTRLSFGFTTIAFGLVPPWGMMVGDIQWDWFDEHTAGFNK